MEYGRGYVFIEQNMYSKRETEVDHNPTWQRGAYISVFILHGVQEQTIGRKKWSRLLTWEKVFFDALAINLWQK